MVSCTDMYRISAQISKALGVTDKPFGGLGVILAGDFAQLPPAGRGASSLYSNSIGAWSSAHSLHAQQAVLGKALWHQVTTVVILRRNMRQQGLTPEDCAFRQALQNMRLKACTPEDIALLRTRVVTSAGLHHLMSDPNSRNISIITALNSHRDAINEVSSRRFATENGQQLVRFHSIDSWSNVRSSDSLRQTQRLQQRAVDPNRSSGDVLPGIQEMLWALPPSLTAHRAGILTLCRDMPVMLKNNEATELCATNGAEAYVLSWDSHQDADGHDILDTLFVRLKNPPQVVQLPDLPPNVIPLVRAKTHIKCTLPNDCVVYIDRSQANVLPNFAMTDFGCQGRTRSHNPCHLRFCKGHQSLYTCLACSASLKGMLILDGIDDSKITGGLNGALRREF
ncbi:uncharacterized protein LAESUDRAFT_681806, partial [Laetiporus sulphureus 93-53]